MNASRFVCSGVDCVPVCDHCQFYRFNGDERGAYTGDGECVYPLHRRSEDPSGGCEDFFCAARSDADPLHAERHFASMQRSPRL